MEKKINWLSKRLKELGKTKQDLASCIGVSTARLTDYENGTWRFQVNQIGKASKFLNFDKTALLDFLSGEISEQQLWEAKPFVITEQDKAILQAVKSVAGLQKQTENNSDTSKQTKIQINERV